LELNSGANDLVYTEDMELSPDVELLPANRPKEWVDPRVATLTWGTTGCIWSPPNCNAIHSGGHAASNGDGAIASTPRISQSPEISEGDQELLFNMKDPPPQQWWNIRDEDGLTGPYTAPVRLVDRLGRTKLTSLRAKAAPYTNGVFKH
jgi:hypothetical protein